LITGRGESRGTTNSYVEVIYAFFFVDAQEVFSVPLRVFYKKPTSRLMKV